jgi:hypothetical protein
MGADKNSMAWVFWLNHSEMIEKVSAKFALDARLDMDDFKQELLLRLVRRHGDYDQKKCRPVTWAWWQARAVRSAVKVNRELLQFEHSDLELGTDDGATERKLEAVAGVAWAKSQATKLEWTSICARASGASENELETIFGCSSVTVRRRVNRLKTRLENSYGI